MTFAAFEAVGLPHSMSRYLRCLPERERAPIDAEGPPLEVPQHRPACADSMPECFPRVLGKKGLQLGHPVFHTKITMIDIYYDIFNIIPRPLSTGLE